MLSPYFINESFIDQLFNQNAVYLLITRLQPGKVEFGNCIIQSEDKYLQIQKGLASFTFKNQTKNFYQIKQSQQSTRFTYIFQDPEPQKMHPKLQSFQKYLGMAIHFYPKYSFSAIIGVSCKNDDLIGNSYFYFNNQSVSYFFDLLQRSQISQKQLTLQICLPNYAQSYFRVRHVWKDRYLYNIKLCKQPIVEMGLGQSISNSLYFNALLNYNVFEYRVNTITQFSWNYKGLITKFGLENKMMREFAIQPFFQMEMILLQDPNLFVKCQIKNEKPSLQINFQYDTQKD